MNILSPVKIEDWKPDVLTTLPHSEEVSQSIGNIFTEVISNDPSPIEISSVAEADALLKNVSTFVYSNSELDLNLNSPSQTKANLVLAVLSDLKVLRDDVVLVNNVVATYESKNVLESFRKAQSLNLIELTSKAVNLIEKFKNKKDKKAVFSKNKINYLLFSSFSKKQESLPDPLKSYMSKNSIAQAIEEEILAESAVTVYNSLPKEEDIDPMLVEGLKSCLERSISSLYELIAYTVRVNQIYSDRINIISDMYDIADTIDSFSN